MRGHTLHRINNAVLARASHYLLILRMMHSMKIRYRAMPNNKQEEMQYKEKEMIKHKNWQIYKMNPHKHTRTALSICSFLCSIIFHYPQCIHLFAFMFDFEWPGRENQNMQKQTAKTRIKFYRMNQMEFRLIRLMEAIAF